MTDLQIDGLELLLIGKFSSEEFQANIHELCALARIGAEVMPRPIEEAPKDGTFTIAFEPSGHIHVLQFCVDGYWRGSLLDLPESWSPTHFIPLSALPKPTP